MRVSDVTGLRTEVELFKGLLAYLVLREVPDLQPDQALTVVADTLSSHGTEPITASNTLVIIDEVYGAARALSDGSTP